MLRTVEVRWLEQGSGWGRCCGRSRAAGGCLRRWRGAEATMTTGDGAACAGSGEQKRRWRLAMARCLRRRAACGDGTEALGAWGDG
ncbi:unnamed protein product [Linum trigynum]|uniref:Uncharacterized protein n=1 Tax=Linum trigynum TaxID=586398 RepID=A0AAV2E3S6_9ROSI